MKEYKFSIAMNEYGLNATKYSYILYVTVQSKAWEEFPYQILYDGDKMLVNILQDMLSTVTISYGHAVHPKFFSARELFEALFQWKYEWKVEGDLPNYVKKILSGDYDGEDDEEDDRYDAYGNEIIY